MQLHGFLNHKLFPSPSLPLLWGLLKNSYLMVHFFLIRAIEVVYLWHIREALECDKLAGFSFNLGHKKRGESSSSIYFFGGKSGQKPSPFLLVKLRIAICNSFRQTNVDSSAGFEIN